MTYRKYHKKPQKADQILKNVLRFNGVDKKLQNYQFVLHWEEIVGAELAEFCKPDGIYGECLMVAVPNSVWNQEISFRKNIILSRLQDYLEPEQRVTELKCRINQDK